MVISSPCIITPRLLPGVCIDGAFLSIEYSPVRGDETRTRYRIALDIPNDPGTVHFVDDNIQSGCGGGSLQDGLASALTFLSAAGEAINYETRTGRESDNADLFPRHIAEWAAQCSDELSMLAYEIEESETAVIVE